MADNDRAGRDWGGEETLPGPDQDDGSKRVENHPPGTGEGRGPGLLLVVILAIIAVAIPVAWGVGALATLGEALGTIGLIVVWLAWGAVVAVFLWAIWAMWRRAA